MVKIEIGVLKSQCLARRISDKALLIDEIVRPSLLLALASGNPGQFNNRHLALDDKLATPSDDVGFVPSTIDVSKHEDPRQSFAVRRV